MRRWHRAFLPNAASVVIFAVAASCGEGEKRSSFIASDAGFDAASLGDTAAPPQITEPEPGDVCGIASGLQASAPWPLRGGCSTRAGWSALPGPQSAAVSFSTPTLAGETSPAIGAGIVWLGTADGDIVALSTSGTIHWAHHTGAAVTSSPAIDANGNAVVGGRDGFLYAIAPGDGTSDPDAGPTDGGPSIAPAKVVFSLSVGPIASSPVIGGDGTIYVGTTDGKLVAVPGDGAAVRWTVTTNDTFGSSPALGQDGTVYVGSTDSKLYAVAPDGAVKWALDLGAPVHGSPAVGGDGSIYVGTTDGKLHAVRSVGNERWQYATGGPIGGTPAVYAGTVYVGSEDKSLHAVSTVDGTPRWTYALSGTAGTPVIDPAGTVYVGATDGRVYAIASTGSLFFAVNVKGSVKSAPAIGIGPILYVTTENALVAVGP
ncbi:MAG TPA: PQQ-binding-like beta-propeller repeat protein [Labilithrix sp.]|nr:PQQ-binding-like beta-propeller repeat protein [Labilithrix sp.]